MDAGGSAMHGAIAEDRPPKGDFENKHNILVYFVPFVFFVDEMFF
jgi:hypothetical protein